jgi:hypothetical protein
MTLEIIELRVLKISPRFEEGEGGGFEELEIPASEVGIAVGVLVT